MLLSASHVSFLNQCLSLFSLLLTSCVSCCFFQLGTKQNFILLWAAIFWQFLKILTLGYLSPASALREPFPAHWHPCQAPCLTCCSVDTEHVWMDTMWLVHRCVVHFTHGSGAQLLWGQACVFSGLNPRAQNNPQDHCRPFVNLSPELTAECQALSWCPPDSFMSPEMSLAPWSGFYTRTFPGQQSERRVFSVAAIIRKCTELAPSWYTASFLRCLPRTQKGRKS